MHPPNIADQYPPSPLQQGMLFHHRHSERSGVDIEQIICTIREDIDPAALSSAWETIIARHAVLRTSFVMEADGTPVQRVHSQVGIPWEEQDWRSVPASQVDARLSAFLTEDRLCGFDMATPPLLRFTLLRTDEAEYRLVWTFHHALMDGRSFVIVLNEVFAVYEAARTGDTVELPSLRPYRDYLDWLTLQDTAKAEGYWRSQLAGFSAPTPLIGANASAPQGESHQGDQQVVIDQQTTAELKEFAASNGVTLNTLVQAAWAMLLSRYSGEPDVLYGVVRAGRKGGIEGADSMVGLFINTLPLRVQVPADAEVTTWLRQLRANWIEMRDYEHTPLVQIQRWSDVPAGSRLFESILMFENYELGRRLQDQGGKWAARSFRLYEQTGYPITLTAYAAAEIVLQIEFDPARIDRAVVVRMLNHLRTLVVAMMQRPHERLQDLPMLDREEREQILTHWNETECECPPDALHRLIEDQVRRSPNSIAVTFEDQTVTYRELNDRANQLAHCLRKSGVQANVLVGICVERSIDMVVAVLGVLKSGGAYVPLDPAFPKERLGQIIEDSAIGILITQRQTESALPAWHGKSLYIDDSAIRSESQENLPNAVDPHHLAYVIFTSGSTGRPKGVQIEHHALVNLLQSMAKAPGLTAQDVLLAVTTLSFDIAGLELFLPLITGASVVIARSDIVRDGRSLLKLLESSGATVMQATPSTWRMLLEGGWTADRRLKIICGGEAMPPELAKALLPHSSSLWNVYGPTETTIWSTVFRVTAPENIIPIGRPIDNTTVYILDSSLQPVPIGVAGELWIGGDGLARGYLRLPKLTNERFLPDPFNSHKSPRMYKTGDLCRWRADGVIECLGRNDFQIKIRGYRVELADIESILVSHPGVKQAVVTLHQKSGEKQLVAYIVAETGSQPQPESLRRHCAERLPGYMVPAAYVALEKMPLTPNGKVDRKALPAAPDLAASDSEWSAPESQTEEQIAAIWQDVLGAARIGRDGNFFDLGGHSLLLMRVQIRLEQMFAREIPIVELFRYSTIRSLADYLDGHDTKPASTTRTKGQINSYAELAKRRLERKRAYAGEK